MCNDERKQSGILISLLQGIFTVPKVTFKGWCKVCGVPSGLPLLQFWATTNDQIFIMMILGYLERYFRVVNPGGKMDFNGMF